jgi:hypothetical protein
MKLSKNVDVFLYRIDPDYIKEFGWLEYLFRVFRHHLSHKRNLILSTYSLRLLGFQLDLFWGRQ